MITKATPVAVETKVPESNSGYKTYKNSDYSFQINYPSRFDVTNNDKREPYYDTVAVLVGKTSVNESFTLRVIHDVDIYKNEKPENVEKMELKDSGLKFGTDTTKIGSYSAAITVIDIIVSKNVRSTVLTIAHPTKNLFVVIDINADLARVEFEDIVSSFRFTDNSEQVVIDNLVRDFYSALNKQDGKLLFGYFTQPETSQEKADFAWLTGADLKEDAFYRVFLRQGISNPKINEVKRVNDTTFTVKITDQLLGTPSAGNEEGVRSPITRNVILTATKLENKWLADKFTNPSNTTNTGNAASSKYNGFGQ